MATEYLADENEREEGADFYLKAFSFYTPGQLIPITLKIGPLKDEHRIGEISALVQSAFRCRSIEHEKLGLLFKRWHVIVQLEPMAFHRENMLKVTNTQYDVILRFDVKVEVTSDADGH